MLTQSQLVQRAAEFFLLLTHLAVSRGVEVASRNSDGRPRTALGELVGVDLGGLLQSKSGVISLINS